MSRSRARGLGVIILLLALGLGAGVLWRDAAGVQSVANALQPANADAGEAPAGSADAEPAPPPKPKRQIVPDLQVVVNIPSGRLQLIDGDSVVRTYPVSVGSARTAEAKSPARP
ncbi:MAG TPA: L,D-transpeptidase [Longimicrobium sp.]|nr:L,D-transpeptidase [Longimicrobium sp.]